MPHGFSRHGQEDSEGDKHDDVGDVKSLLLIVVEPSGKEHPVYTTIPRCRRARKNGKLEHTVAVGHEGKQPYDADQKSKHKCYCKLLVKRQTHGQSCKSGSKTDCSSQSEGGWQIHAGFLYLKDYEFQYGIHLFHPGSFSAFTGAAQEQLLPANKWFFCYISLTNNPNICIICLK